MIHKLPKDLLNIILDFLMPSVESVRKNKSLLLKNIKHVTSWQNMFDFDVVDNKFENERADDEIELMMIYNTLKNECVYKLNSNILPSFVKNLEYFGD
jgi:hypothetical protein